MFATEKENQLYPTPDPTIEKMITGVKKMNEVNGRFSKIHGPLLEPEAGFGHILDYLLKEPDDDDLFERRRKSKYEYPHKSECFAIEIDYHLRLVLQGKGYKVLTSDFLRYPVNEKKFKTILMNPPFNDGLDHLFHAWDLLDDGGVVACLLNAESVLSVTNKPRQRLADLIDLYGHYEELGPVFSDSEHPTNVNVACVWLKKPENKKTSIFDGVEFEKDYTDWSTVNPDMLVKSNVVSDLVSRYNGCVEILRKRHQEQQLLDIYLDNIDWPVRGSHDRMDTKEIFEMKYSISDQIEVLKSRFWQTVFTRTKIGQRTTESYRQQFEQGAKIQSHMAFNEQNVKDVLEFFLLNQSEIMEQCVVQVFDDCSRYHSYTLANSEGWKTNKSYKMSKKIIHPHAVQSDKWGPGISVNYSARAFYDDLDKACCFLAGKTFDNIYSSYMAMSDYLRSKKESPCESEFFRMKPYKKGTVHFEFKDLKLVDDFNRVVASTRGKEIGPNY
jgi:hypothetical protein